jgi:hypothetical protein
VKIEKAMEEARKQKERDRADDEKRRDRGRLEELRRREQDRILEVGGYSSYSLLLSVIHCSAVAGCLPSNHGDVFYTQGRRREDEEKKGRVDLEPINITPGSVPKYFRISILYVYFNTP